MWRLSKKKTVAKLKNVVAKKFNNTKSDNLTMGKREKKIGSEIMDERDRIFDIDDHSPAQTVVYKACTFIASLLYCVAERASLT